MFSWIKLSNGNVVVSNNSELMLVGLMASDGGEYRCLVENRAGNGNATFTLNGK